MVLRGQHVEHEDLDQPAHHLGILGRPSHATSLPKVGPTSEVGLVVGHVGRCASECKAFRLAMPA